MNIIFKIFHNRLFTILPICILSIVLTSCSGSSNDKTPKVVESINTTSTEQYADIYSYDTLVALNKRNVVRKQIQGRWVLDSIAFSGKRINAKLMLDTFDIQGIEFKYNFDVFASRKMGKAIGNRPIGVYVIDDKILTLHRVDGTVVNAFQIDLITDDKLVLSEEFKNNRKIYYFNLDGEMEETNRKIFGPNYKK